MKTISKLLLAISICFVPIQNKVRADTKKVPSRDKADTKNLVLKTFNQFELLQKKHQTIESDLEEIITKLGSNGRKVESDIINALASINVVGERLFENQIVLGHKKIISSESIVNEPLIINNNNYSRKVSDKLRISLNSTNLMLRDQRVRINNTAAVVMINEYLKLIPELNDWCDLMKKPLQKWELTNDKKAQSLKSASEALTKSVPKPRVIPPKPKIKVNLSAKPRRPDSTLKQSLNNLDSKLSGRTSVNVPQGRYSIANFANYESLIRRKYMDATVHPLTISGNPVVKVQLVIARNGNVISARIIGTSGLASWDRAVQKALERVKRIAPFPAEMKGARKTFNLNFNSRSFQ